MESGHGREGIAEYLEQSLWGFRIKAEQKSIADLTPFLTPFCTLTDKQFEKVSFVLDLIEQLNIIPEKYLKKLKGSDDIWEVRVQYGNNIFRLLGFFEANNIVILNHAFTKKTQKTPAREINIAEKRKREYLKERGLT